MCHGCRRHCDCGTGPFPCLQGQAFCDFVILAVGASRDAAMIAVGGSAVALTHFLFAQSAERTKNMNNMINVNLALEKRTDGINEALEMMDAGFLVSHKQVAKNNCIKDAFVMNAPNYNMVPTVYPDPEMMEQSDEEIAHVLRRMFLTYARNADVTMIQDASYIKENVFPKLVNGQNIPTFENEGTVYIPYLDLAICFSIRVPEFSEGIEQATVKLSKALLEASGLTICEVRDAAMRNMKNEGCVIKGLTEVISEMMDMSAEDMGIGNDSIPMIILTNDQKFYGAAEILSAEVLREVENCIGCSSFTILPSSVHETIITSMGDKNHLEGLKAMVSEVNFTSVSVEDFLSNSIYIYQDGKISIMD